MWRNKKIKARKGQLTVKQINEITKRHVEAIKRHFEAERKEFERIVFSDGTGSLSGKI